MIFKYDPDKSLSNKTKHGIDFEEAQILWRDSNLVKIQANTVDDEKRFMGIGKIKGKHWSAIFCELEDAIRIISVRRSRQNEVKFYES